MEDDLTGIVSFTDDAHHLPVLKHWQGPDVFRSHHDQGLKYRMVVGDGVDLMVMLVFGLQHLGNGFHGGHSGVVIVGRLAGPTESWMACSRARSKAAYIPSKN